MIFNPTYSYIYYNQFVGGLKGAYGKYETDYYFVSLKEGSEWLIKYLEEKQISGPVKIRSNFSVKWFFRNHRDIQAEYFRNEERSQYDWDYAIVTNRYIPLSHLKNKTWPPANAIKIIYAGNVPICAVLERKSKDDYHAYEALINGRTKEAIGLFEKALKKDFKDEMIYYNFASALFDDGQIEKADSALKKCLEINPDFDLALMFLGNISKAQNKNKEAVDYYKNVIRVNRKYLEAYVEWSGLIMKEDVKKSRELLVECMNINPQFKPAIIGMAETYRTSNPEVAKKYDELAKTIK